MVQLSAVVIKKIILVLLLSVVLGTGVTASPGSTLETQNLDPTPDSLKENLYYNMIPVGLYTH